MAKISKELVEELGQMIMTHQSRPELLAMVYKYQILGFSKQRFLWDCLWCVPSEVHHGWFAKVYSLDCNDNHITTALNSWFNSTGISVTFN